MDIGIGLPNSITGTTGRQVLDWAQRAEQRGFSTLATVGAVSYPSYEELTVLGAAAAVTERIRLMTNVLIAPARSAAELAKQAATVDQLSNGRLALGLGVGWRDADYVLTGRSFDDRGAHFDELLGGLQTAWSGKALVDGTRPPAPRPAQSTGVPLMIGGGTDDAIRRVVEHGIGYTAGGLPPDAVAEMIDRVQKAWTEAGRQGRPRFAALAYFGLGDTEDRSRETLLDYYAPRGEEMATMIADSALRSPDAIRGAVAAFADVGVDDLILDPTVSDVEQVDLLADVVL